MLPRAFRRLFPFVWSIGSLALTARGGSGSVDLTALENYAAQTVPAYITRSNTPATNPITDTGATLGRVLFYDPRLSRNNTISCSSCHQQAHAFSDLAIASTGVSGTTGRHSMRLINAGAGTEVKFFWDERAVSLEAQTSQPIQDHAEMGFSGANGDPSLGDLIAKLSAIDSYRVLFTLAFGDPTITEDRLQRALAQFVRSIQSFDSRYDQGRAQVGGDNVNFPNFTAAENAGKQLFVAAPNNGGAGCAACHQAPEFSIDPNSRNNGVTSKIGGGTDLANTRSPTLRDLLAPNGSANGPFMHDGSMATLARVIDHYNAIPADNTNLDPRLRRAGGLQNLNLTQTQKDNLVAFLATLTGSAVYTSAKLSDPFDANAQLTLNVFAAGSVSLQSNADGTITLSRVTARGLTYQVQGSPDNGSWTTLTNVTPDANGQCSATVTPGSNLHFRYALEVPEAAPAVYAASDVASLPVTTSALDTWRQSHFSETELALSDVSGPSADPDADGLSNLLEYALGLDPRSASTTGLPETSLTANEWIYRYTRPDAATDVTYAVEISSDLLAWTTEGVTENQSGSEAGVTIWEAHTAAPTSGVLFFRLRVTFGGSQD